MDKFVIKKHKITESNGASLSESQTSSGMSMSTTHEAKIRAVAGTIVSETNSGNCEIKCSTLIGGCIDEVRFEKWKTNRPWLSTNSSGGVICLYCSEIQNHGALKDSKMHIETVFIKGLTLNANKSKKLNDKISDHGRSKFHLKCESILNDKKNEAIEKSFSEGFRKWEEKNLDKLQVTARVFRTAYLVCKENEPFLLFKGLCELQALNGLDIGSMLHSDHTCANIIHFISKKMSSLLTKYIIDSYCVFSILVDESTNKANKSCLILYIRCIYDGSPCNYFYDIVELNSLTGEAVAESITSCFINNGISAEILSKQLIGFASDGAANLQGMYRGAATYIRDKYNPNIVVIHCLNHKLELAVHDVIDNMSVPLHFKSLMDTLYSHFSASPKNQSELTGIAMALGLELKKIGRIFDIRWVASSCNTVTAVMSSYTLLIQYFTNRENNHSLPSRSRATFRGFLQKMTSWNFIMELVLFRDVLETIKPLSLYLQCTKSDAITASSEIKICTDALAAMKDKNGVHLQAAQVEYSATKTFKGHPISEPLDTAKKAFTNFKRQFLQGLVDNTTARFSSASLFFKECEVLNKMWWPQEENELVLFGDEKIESLCNTLKFLPSNTDTSIVVKTLKEFRQFKQVKKIEFIGETLRELIQRIQIIPVSSAECERGFSVMNNTVTKLRNRMQTETLASVMFVIINGPCLKDFPAERFAAEWIRAGRHSATDTPHRKESSKISSHQSKLFL